MTTRRERLRKAVKRGVNALRPRRSPPIPVFLFGEMRSGTNMLLDCFDSCIEAETFNETDPEAFVAYELRDLATIADLVHRSRATHVVFKPTADTNRAAEIMDAFPGSRSVWIYRRYQDAVNSAMEKWQQHNEYLRIVLEDPARASWRARNLAASDRDLIRLHHGRGLSEQSARALIWYLRNAPCVREQLDRRDDLLLVNYETLVTSPDSELRRIFAFLGIPFRERYRRHLSTSSIRKAVDPEVDSQIEALCQGLTTQLDAAVAHQLQRTRSAAAQAGGAA